MRMKHVIIRLAALLILHPSWAQAQDRSSPSSLATSSYRYERVIYDSAGDGWCDLWCDIFQYEPQGNLRLDSDGDGVSDYDEMIHFRSPFIKEPPERVRSDNDILELKRQRHKTALRQLEPVPPLPSTRWKTDKQKVDLTEIRQDTTTRQMEKPVHAPTRQVICNPAANPLGDDDGDGLTNLQELAQGLPPCAPNTDLLPGVRETFVTVGGESRLAVDFRLLELPDLTYGYQVQESVDLQNWNDVDMYTNRVKILNTSDTGGTIDVATVHTSLSPMTYPKTFMRVQFHDSWPPQPLEFAYVNLAGLVSHTRDNTLTILPDNTLHKKIFDSYASTTNSKWARFSWTNRLDLTGVAFDSGKTCTLISPRHVLMAAHFNRAKNDVVRFHTKDGTVVTRTITKVFETTIAEGDIAVGILDSAVNDVTFYKVLPPRTDWPIYLTDALAHVTRYNNREVLVRRAATFSGGINGTRFLTFGLDTEVPSFYEGGVSSGDSGNPSFILVRGEPVLIHTLTWSTTGGPFLSDPENYNKINQFMSDLGGGHQLTPVYLNP